MSGLNLVAGAQYDDWKGQIALDDADNVNVNKFLRSHGTLGEGDFLFGYELFMHPEAKWFDGKVDVTFYVGPDADSIREEKIPDMEILEFFKLFKRINIVAQSKYRK